MLYHFLFGGLSQNMRIPKKQWIFCWKIIWILQVHQVKCTRNSLHSQILCLHLRCFICYATLMSYWLWLPYHFTCHFILMFLCDADILDYCSVQKLRQHTRELNVDRIQVFTFLKNRLIQCINQVPAVYDHQCIVGPCAVCLCIHCVHVFGEECLLKVTSFSWKVRYITF